MKRLVGALAALALGLAPAAAFGADKTPLANYGGGATPLKSGDTVPVVHGGTGAVTETAHGVLLGQATSPITATAAGASGQPLLSGGASADPAYGTLGAAFGGLGLTSITSHCVLVGAGTSAAHLVCPATANQVLLDQGASSDPAFGALPCAALPALTGDVTSSACATTIGSLKVAGGMIQANAVSLAKLATQADKTILANISGSTAVPTAAGLSAILDNVFSSTQGSILYRDASGWLSLGPGLATQLLQSGGASANPSWVTASAGGGSVFTQGTWTPVLAFGGGTTGITYSNQNGLYIQIGKLVTVYCSFQLTNKGSSTGNATVSGLPFAISTGANIFQVVGVATTSTFTGGFNLNFGQAGGVGNTTIALFNISETVQITNSSFSNTTQILFTASYFTN
jgi:hypothetical protein